MFRIALCEDERVFSETQEKTCRRILEKLDIIHSISVFDSGEGFFEAFSQGCRFDLIFLDIVMDGMSGMELAKKIRESDRETEIVFITSSREHAIEGYEVGALRYLMKPPDAGELERLIAGIYEDKFRGQYIVLASGARSERIAIKDIISLETVGRKVEIVLTDRTLYYSGKLEGLLSGLPKGRFIRCHQAFALNIDNIRELTRTDAIAVNGKVIPISRPNVKAVQGAFLMNMQEI